MVLPGLPAGLGAGTTLSPVRLDPMALGRTAYPPRLPLPPQELHHIFPSQRERIWGGLLSGIPHTRLSPIHTMGDCFSTSPARSTWRSCTSHGAHAGVTGRERVSAERPAFSADPTRIFRMPEDQVVKRGTTVQLECRVKHDPSLKLTVSWLKDDQPLYIGNRSPLRPSPFLVPNPGIGHLCPACS